MRNGIKVKINGKEFNIEVPENLGTKAMLEKAINTWEESFQKPSGKVNTLFFGLGFLGSVLFLKLLNGLIKLLNTFNFETNEFSAKVIFGLSIGAGLFLFYLPILEGKLEAISLVRRGQKGVTIIKAAESCLIPA